MEQSSESAEVVVVQPGERSGGALALKRLVQALFLLPALPRLAAYRLARRALPAARAFSHASESIARVPGMRGVYLRQAFYRRTLAACGRDVYFGWLSVFSDPDARVGEGAYIGRGCRIGHAEIGAEVMLSDGVQVLSGARQHGRSPEPDRSYREQPQEYRTVSVGRGAWIGTNAVLMADVGESAIVGAGAVVNRPVPAQTLAAGVPATVVKSLEVTDPTA